MRPSSIAVLAAAAAGPASAAAECVSGLHMIVARGTGEPEGTGSTGYLAKQVASRIKGSDIEGLDYPATMTDPDYITSVGEGSDEMRETVREYVKACPDTKVAVMGYSQVRRGLPVERASKIRAGKLTVSAGRSGRDGCLLRRRRQWL